MPPKAKRRKQRRKPQPLVNVISLRITDEEKEILNRLKGNGSKTSSDLLRECLAHWLAMYHGEKQVAA